MKSTFLVLAVTLFGHIWLQGQTTRNLDHFTRMSAATGIEVLLVKDRTNKAVIEVENIEVNKVITEVRGDRLVIKFAPQKGMWNRHKKVKASVTLHYQSLSEIQTSTGAVIKSNGTIDANDVTLEASTGGIIELNLASEEVEIDASSGGILKLGGAASELEVDASSGGIVNAYELNASHVDADASSGGLVKVTATRSISADASSGGVVNYKGNPEKVSLDKSVSGAIHNRS